MPRCLRTMLGQSCGSRFTAAAHRHLSQRRLHAWPAPKAPSAAAAPAAAALQYPDWIFPYTDAFNLDGREVDADTIISMLTPQVTEERLARIEAVLDERTYNIIPIAENFYDMGNLAALLRSADALGFGAVHHVSNGDSSYKQSRRAASGSEKWMDVKLWGTTTECLTSLKGAGYQIVATHLSSTSVPFQDIDWTRPTAFVLGNEKKGVTQATLDLADCSTAVPMVGFVESFNCSVAAALMLYEARHQRLRKLGKHGDLGEEEKRLLRTAWLLRSVKYSKAIVQQLLDRPPAVHQQHLFKKHNWPVTVF